MKRFLLICMIFILSGCSLFNNQNGRIEISALEVIDGDTIRAKVNGKVEKIRFLLIDTPEMKDEKMGGPQPFAFEAKEFTKRMLQNGKVEIELDVNERDKYGRILAYVYVNDQSVQEELLRQGLARVAYIFPPNTKYVDRYQQIQKEAQAKAVGIWSIENYVQEDGFYPKHKKFSEDINIEKNCVIKGNINSKGEKIYHVPGGANYESTKPEKCFQSEEEAKAAGFRKAKR
jgi:micrococcal nuclease